MFTNNFNNIPNGTQFISQPVNQISPPIPEEDTKLILINDGYYEHLTGYLFTDKKNVKRRFTDFTITKITRLIKIGANDSQKEFFSLVLKSETGFEESVVIPIDKFAELPKEIERNHHQFFIFTDRYSRAHEFFKRVSKEILRRELNAERVQTICMYSRWGWSLPSANGVRQFFCDTMSVNNHPKILSSPIIDLTQQRNYLQRGLIFLCLQPSEILLPLAVYALSAYADALFSDAGYPLEHSLMLVGKSGFGKTSVARAIFSPFEPENKRIHTVEGTEAAMKLLVRDSRDDVLVIDDFNLEGSRQELNRKLRNMRLLIRIQADKSAPEKFGANNNVERCESRGGTVFTGEVPMLGQISSSELRYLKVFFNQSLSGETLSNLQSSHSYWCFLVSEWIRYLEKYYVNFINHISNEFPKMRQNSTIVEPRLRDALIHHTITAQLFMGFLRIQNLIDASYVTQFMAQFSDIMNSLVKKQGNDSNQYAIQLLFVSELRNLRGNGNISIASNLDEYAQRPKDFLGYDDGKGHILLKKDDTFRIISESYRNRGEYFPTSANELPKILYENNLTKTNSGSFTVKASSLIEGRPPMICLIKDAYEKMLAELAD